MKKLTINSKNYVHAYIVSYTPEIYNNVEAPFLPLNNTENLRPDWQEYWPIRNFLINEKLIEDHYYGFLSPRFKEKTGLDAQYITDYIGKQSGNNDLFIFSPQPDMGAFFLNIFDQNELFDPGFKDACKSFLEFAKIEAELSNIVMDSRNIIFSNYFFAKPIFWRKWLSICEILFNECETNSFEAKNYGWLSKTNYRNGIQRKVFIIERIASLILSIDKKWKSHSHNPFLFPYSASKLSKFPEDAVKCDALKIAFNETQNIIFLNMHNKMISNLKSKLQA